MRILATLFYIFLILVGISFAALNATPVEVNVYFTQIKVPVSILMILTFGIGLLFGFFIFILRHWRLKSENRQLKNQLKLTQCEIKNLRTIPVTDNYPRFKGD